MTLALGLNIPNFGATATPTDLRGWARFAEDNGFAIALTSDHVAPTPDVAELYPSPFYDPFATLAWLAASTDRIELGTTVTVLPYRHPLLTARLASNIDGFSGGRFVLGVGVGWSEAEYTALEVPFGRRGRITDEYLGAIIQAWTNDQVSLAGEFVSYDDVHTGPRPVRTPHPPVWVGGMSRAAVRRAARFGDAWHPINPQLGWLRDVGLPGLAEEAAASGRPLPAVIPRIRARQTEGEVSDADRPLGVGSRRQILTDIRDLEALGCPCVILDTNPDHPRDRQPTTQDWRVLEAIARDVLGP